MTRYSDDDIKTALEGCASEPVHIPGTVQPFACLLAIDVSSLRILYASANTRMFFGCDPTDLLGGDLSDRLPREFWHALWNGMAHSRMESRALSLGEFPLGDKACSFRGFKSADLIVIEIEETSGGDLAASDFSTLGFLVEEFETCQTQDALFKTATELLHHLSGYDRVLIYRFDREANGEVLAEHKGPDMPGFVGLRFPHWDIPEQARAIMLKLPLRMISSVDQDDVPLLALESDAPPLDITLAACRGVSAVHMEYLRNMGTQSTMTLSVVVEGALWGIISFHNRVPRVPGLSQRDLLVAVGKAFSTKLQTLQHKERLQLVDRVDKVNDAFNAEFDQKDWVSSFAGAVCQTLQASGMVLVQGGEIFQHGETPEMLVVESLIERARQDGKLIAIENLSEAYPNFANALKGCAGALILAPAHDRAIIVFRAETSTEISWAGNPSKTIEDVDGRVRLSPRGSFATYLEKVKGVSSPWSDQDLYFADRIWSLVNTVERRMLMSSLNRQQEIMIGELNHRVRNILSLIRAVPRQARGSSYGSLDSYSASLEARINALAVSHNLASGSVVASVAVRDLIETEFRPFGEDRLTRCTINGEGGSLRPGIAPIFSLVIHELVTNAVKYGALVNETGTVTITLQSTDEGLDLHWQERGGPPVVEPAVLGFGTTLITQAIPYEMDGDANIQFDPAGVVATFFVPKEHFDRTAPTPSAALMPITPVAVLDRSNGPDLSGVTCLVVEDNFVIAQALKAQLLELGVGFVDVTGSNAAALAALESQLPSFAILDVNLGKGETSAPTAEVLEQRSIPFMFVTGYDDGKYGGEAGRFSDRATLKKPTSDSELLSGIADMLKGRGA